MVKLDLSDNKISGKIPNWIWSLSILVYLNLSCNSLDSLELPLINLTHVNYLDLHSNQFHGQIPTLQLLPNVIQLDLSRNYFSSIIPSTIRHVLRYTIFLSLSSNNINGTIPESLCNFKFLQVLDISNNFLSGMIPQCLTNMSGLAVLNLRRNNLTSVDHRPGSKQFPVTALTTWQAMRSSKDNTPGKISNLRYGRVGYQVDTIVVTNKGLEMELLIVLTIFTYIDFSSNKFNGSIPKEIGELKLLYYLNLSNNAFTGSVPSSLSNLSQLEALDLSKNKLRGQIPPELTKLTFLAFLNLSYNKLVGRIPSGAQFSTFDATSFEGNKGLWGPPLTADKRTVFSPKPAEGNHSNPGHEIDWDIICPEIGFTCGFGIAIGSLLFCKRWRKWYYRAMYNMLLKIFPQLEQILGHHRRHVYVHQRYWRR
ncbi:hypothetical protein ACLB2K_069261 [Fragaria x ananassa]